MLRDYGYVNWTILKQEYGVSDMYFDFAIIQRRLLIEYDGEQHFRYVERFHKTKEVFQNARQRDKIKEELAHQNGYDVVRFDYRDILTKSLVAERLKL